MLAHEPVVAIQRFDQTGFFPAIFVAENSVDCFNPDFARL